MGLIAHKVNRRGWYADTGCADFSYFAALKACILKRGGTFCAKRAGGSALPQKPASRHNKANRNRFAPALGCRLK